MKYVLLNKVYVDEHAYRRNEKTIVIAVLMEVEVY